jgi:hypothetical protein
VKYRRWILLAGLTSAVLVACPQPPKPVVACADRAAQTQPSAESVNVSTTASTRVVDATDVSSVEATRMQVAESGGAFQPGQLIFSDYDAGVLRKIRSIEPQAAGITPQGIRKVYLQTEDAMLEDVLSSADACLNFGDMVLDDSTKIQSLAGVRPQAVNGKIGFTNVSVPLGANGAKVTLNGFVQQTLDPKFNLVFSKNSLEKFEISLKGSFAAELKGTMELGGKFALQAQDEKTVSSYKITRAFLVGAVPVVIVLEPQLIVGAKLGLNDKVNVTAGITPTLTLNLGLSYDRNRAVKWDVTSNPASLALNPTFNVTVPTQGNGAVYAKLVLGVKLYGVAGPVLEFKPYIDTDLNTDSTAAFRTGISSSASLAAGFKVLGKGLEVAADLPKPAPAAKNYLCSVGQCTEQKNPVPKSTAP